MSDDHVTIIWQHRYDERQHGKVRVAAKDAKGTIQHIEARGPYKAVTL